MTFVLAGWEDGGMTDPKIHFESYPCGLDPLHMRFVPSSGDWAMVTCGMCLLERPIERPREHRTPADVLARDAELVRIDTLRRALADAEKTMAAMAKVVEGLRNALSVPPLAEQGVLQGPVTAERSQSLVKLLEGLSPVERRALRECGTDRIGGTVWGRGDVLAKLAGKGLIGAGGGLTTRGSIIAERVQAQRDEELFGR